MMVFTIVAFLINSLFTKTAIFLSKKVLHPVRDFLPQTDHDKVKISPFGGSAIFATIFVICVFSLNGKSLFFLLPSFLMFLLGLFDDIKKISSKKHYGLSVGVKLFFQFLVAIFLCLYCLFIDPNFGTYKILIPFVGIFELSMPLPLAFIISSLAFVGTTNAANLTDGLDGLAGKQFFGILVFAIFYLTSLNIINTNLDKILFIFLGAILAFLFFNSNPASIFMGDSGSLGLGAFIASIFVFLRLDLMLPVICFVFFVEALSVILQVGYFKLTKGKRIFRMTPIHHHFQLNGAKEQKIADVAFFITIFLHIILLSSLV